jgi:hypothetical protein
VDDRCDLLVMKTRRAAIECVLLRVSEAAPKRKLLDLLRKRPVLLEVSCICGKVLYILLAT